MMKEPAIIENANGSHQGRANQDSGNLRLRWPLKRQQHGNHDGGVHGQSAEKRDGSMMHLSWPGQVHHAHAQRERAHRNNQHHGSQ